MARILKGSHSFTCTPRVHPQRNEPYLPLPSQPKLVLIYRPQRDERLSWPWVAGWLHTEISVRHRELNPDTVAHQDTSMWLYHKLLTEYLYDYWCRDCVNASSSDDTISAHQPTFTSKVQGLLRTKMEGG